MPSFSRRCAYLSGTSLVVLAVLGYHLFFLQYDFTLPIDFRHGVNASPSPSPLPGSDGTQIASSLPPSHDQAAGEQLHDHGYLQPSTVTTSVTSTASHTAPPVPERPLSGSGVGSPLHEESAISGWQFNAARDADNYGLREEQCDAAFPGLWRDLERAVNHHRATGNITLKDVDISWRSEAMVRAMIYDRKLYVLDLRGCQTNRHHRERALATLQDINRAIISFSGPVPNVEFSFCVEDFAYKDLPDGGDGAVTWGYTRLPQQQNLWLMPDFGFFSWPIGPIGDYSDFRREVDAGQVQFEDKAPQAIWRGSLLTEARRALVAVTAGKPWADVKAISWSWWNWLKKKEILPVSDFCRYQYVLHTEGRSYSGRLKYLLNCHSVPVVHKLDWLENFHQLFVTEGPDQNVVEVAHDFSDLEAKMTHYLAHPDEARRIADNSAATFRDRYLTPAAQACYWRKMFSAWAAVSFEPKFYQTVEEAGKEADEERESKYTVNHYPVGGGHSQQQQQPRQRQIPRGIALETYMLLDVYDDNPWPKS